MYSSGRIQELEAQMSFLTAQGSTQVHVSAGLKDH